MTTPVGKRLPERIVPLRFAALPLDTHPIDTTNELHGFGPFAGPWTPIDWADPADGIDVGWNGDNIVTSKPVMHDITVFPDPSPTPGWVPATPDPANLRARASTISNATFFDRVKARI